MLIYFIIEAVLVSVHPILGLIGIPACLLCHIIKTTVCKEEEETKSKWDEFDYWQDDQGP